LIRISPARVAPRRALPLKHVEGLIAAIGTDDYPQVCLDLLAEQFDVDHWALFCFSKNAVRCVSSASRVHAEAAQGNVQRFVDRCHRVDPLLIALRQRHPEPAYIAEMQAADIRDRQYRQCFELTRVKERISYLVRRGEDLYQMSLYRGSRQVGLSATAIDSFAPLASVIITSASKHEKLMWADSRANGRLDVQSVEHLLQRAPLNLSRRESEVCARAAAGSTILDTATDLHIKNTSVITYRQRAYEKLKISRQCELIALIHQLRAPDA
jgi:DNA-binding CsgD family transcriptional regulator